MCSRVRWKTAPNWSFVVGFFQPPTRLSAFSPLAVEAMQQRVRMRESGVLQREYVARVAKLEVILNRARLDDFAVINENRSLTEVAREILVKSGWISD